MNKNSLSHAQQQSEPGFRRAVVPLDVFRASPAANSHAVTFANEVSNMYTVKKSIVDASDQSSPYDPMDGPDQPEIKISGYDGGTRRVFNEPSLYVSIFIILVASWVCLSKTPVVFWISFLALTAVAVALHVVAERLLFRTNKEFEGFAAPFEGVFVITFGSILPGIGLLAYAACSLATAKDLNFLDELGKLALILVVPIFNFIVWASVRKGYLIRPRLIGLMNGLSLGLSASWTAIWFKTVFFTHGALSCKFGWMLLLFSSPFMLAAAACLSFDLWRKTESKISRITTAFSVIGGVLSMLFVFAPMARTIFVQSLLIEATNSSEVEKTLPLLRTLTTDEDLRPSKYPLNGFSLAALLIPDRGVDSGTEDDKNLYFKITGKSYSTEDQKEQVQNIGDFVGDKLAGLSLSKSQIFGRVDASTLSSSLDWTFTFHNSSAYTQEARSEIGIPKGAVVSRVTLWVDGEPIDGVFASTAKATEAYDAVVNQRRDPLLVTMKAPDRILVQCFPVPANNGELKIRIGFKVPLQTTDKNCTMELPKLLASNFAQPKRHRVNVLTPAMPLERIAGLTSNKTANGYTLTGIIKTSDSSMSMNPIAVQRTSSLPEFATPDSTSNGQRFIVQKLKEIRTPALKHLVVVVDSSASLKKDAEQIAEALSGIPSRLKPTVYFTPETVTEDKKETVIAAKTLQQAEAEIKPDAFLGGQDNGPELREALETAAEQPDSAVLWIHGPQPSPSGVSSILDLVNAVRLYDLQIEEGTNTLLNSLKTEDVSKLLSVTSVSHKSIDADIRSLISTWEHESKKLTVARTLSTSRPQMTVVSDRSTSEQVTCLWANEEVAKLLNDGKQKQALSLASSYHIVTPVTGAVALENKKDYASLSKQGASNADLRSFPGLVGAPVDPRYGQSNEVGRLADFGYDTARDFSRVLTAVSLLMSLILSGYYIRGQKEKTQSVIVKAVMLVLAVPVSVHLIGTFMINNYGGLGGGL